MPLHIEQHDEAVRFSITAFSRPADALARVGGPVSRRFQVATTRRYLRGLADSGA